MSNKNQKKQINLDRENYKPELNNYYNYDSVN
jgi:hypothetical protein